MKKVLKIFGLIVLLYITAQLIPITKHGRGFTIGFPFRVFGKVDEECYITKYFYPEFLIINFIIITIVVLIIYSISKLIKSRLKKYPANRKT